MILAARIKGRKSAIMVIEIDPGCVMGILTEKVYRVLSRTEGKSQGDLVYANGESRPLRVDTVEVEEVKRG